MKGFWRLFKWRQKEKKPLKFVFNTLSDFGERPAYFVAKDVAEELIKRGHQVKLLRTPKEATNQHLMRMKDPTEPEILAFLKNRLDYIDNLHKLGGEDEHVIDFHNSGVEVFDQRKLEKIEQHPAFIMREDRNSPIAPISLRIREGTNKKRLVVTLELPAIETPLKGPLIENHEKILGRMREIIAKTSFIALHKSGIMDVMRDFKRKTCYMSVCETRKSGLMKPEFVKKIADELEIAARHPLKMK